MYLEINKKYKLLEKEELQQVINTPFVKLGFSRKIKPQLPVKDINEKFQGVKQIINGKPIGIKLLIIKYLNI